MKLLYHGALWHGSTALQRAQAFASLPGVTVVQLDTMRGRREQKTSLYERALWRLGWPVDALEENTRLIELARRVRQAPQGQQLTLIALTGYGAPEQKARALAAGFDLHLVKPVDAPSLSALLAQPGAARRKAAVSSS